MQARSARAALCVLPLAVVLSGCAVFDPYPSQPSRSQAQIAAAPHLVGARLYVGQAKSDLQYRATEIARLRGAANAVMLGSAAGAAAAGIYRGSRDLVLGLGLAAATAFTGGHFFADLDIARIYSAGVEALDCVEDVLDRSEPYTAYHADTAALNTAIARLDAARAAEGTRISTWSYEILQQGIRARALAHAVQRRELDLSSAAIRATNTVLHRVSDQVRAAQPNPSEIYASVGPITALSRNFAQENAREGAEGAGGSAGGGSGGSGGTPTTRNVVAQAENRANSAQRAADQSAAARDQAIRRATDLEGAARIVEERVAATPADPTRAAEAAAVRSVANAANTERLAATRDAESRAAAARAARAEANNAQVAATANRTRAPQVDRVDAAEVRAAASEVARERSLVLAAIAVTPVLRVGDVTSCRLPAASERLTVSAPGPILVRSGQTFTVEIMGGTSPYHVQWIGTNPPDTEIKLQGLTSGGTNGDFQLVGSTATAADRTTYRIRVSDSTSPTPLRLSDEIMVIYMGQ